ncbi:MAG: DHH family phosphoesterase [bacterium]|nr:DHH family phosphoesterase [bacterium]
MSAYKIALDMIAAAKHVCVLQADNPDGDSLSSSLALEALLSEQNKKVSLVCGIDMPAHLKYLPGWDRITKQAPTDCDLVIIVDVNTETLFETLDTSRQLSWLKAKPTIVIDHHTETSGISWATETISEICVATGEIIYRIAKEGKWPLPLDACEMITVSILSDSLGFSSEGTSPESVRIVSELMELGVSIAKLENARRELMRKEPELLPYKGELLQRVELHSGGRIATITIPWKEIEKYSQVYNPTMLVMEDIRMTVGVKIVIGFKVYNDGKITAKIRCNSDGNIADKLAAHFGGGGHPYAAGFKINQKRDFEELKSEVIAKAEQLLNI